MPHHELNVPTATGILGAIPAPHPVIVMKLRWGRATIITVSWATVHMIIHTVQGIVLGSDGVIPIRAASIASTQSTVVILRCPFATPRVQRRVISLGWGSSPRGLKQRDLPCMALAVAIGTSTSSQTCAR